MYEAHFGLNSRPFGSTPDGDFYYPATNHERSLSALLSAVVDLEGIVILTGEPGTGKTLLCHRLLERLGPEVTNVFVANSHLPNRSGLLQAILFDLSQPYLGLSEQELRLSVMDNILKTYEAGRRTVILVDEAQHLNTDLLEELRLLGNLEAKRGRAVQIVLIGQPGLLHTLQQPETASFRQRVAVRLSLNPLDRHESADYLAQHIRAAGGRSQAIFTDEALEIIATGSHGVPRLLNQAGHQALLIAHSNDMDTVDAEVALESLSILGIQSEPADDGLSLAPLNQEREHFIEMDDLASDPVLPLTEGDEDLPPPPKRRPEGNGKSHERYTPPRRPA
jgi:type II secretory pathway predicted ATPase ExeA